MPNHEHKTCPRCQQPFECKVGSILLCQCSVVRLTEAERDYLHTRYSDCLCASCMKVLQTEFNVRQFENRLNRLMNQLRQ
ncbi:cysteine-rich CWC family protein [Pontibacter qinzhouensis]|uniref:Cysteine-rich CWC family protein n=1 Tax=Pontibacter qinzhouensis TaxID=2603253 RepID=A0A5C8KC00_9BACT|nr:cysteine-rich CWC family protein [Pontibacter qinzhouensis]TXK51295.1 cysteine-rich CWC family protein [Pontibacter qinzhouensis]